MLRPAQAAGGARLFPKGRLQGATRLWAPGDILALILETDGETSDWGMGA